MPTVLRIGPYRFFFFSSEPGEPAHVHVDRDEDDAKFWLEPVALAANHGFRRHELNAIGSLVLENQEFLRETWHAYFPD
jgi:hypothetical protein